jgi:hypothetical protein
LGREIAPVPRRHPKATLASKSRSSIAGMDGLDGVSLLTGAVPAPGSPKGFYGIDLQRLDRVSGPLPMLAL